MEEEGLLRGAGATTHYQPSSAGQWLPIPRAFLVQQDESTARSSSSSSPSLPRRPEVTTQFLICSGRHIVPIHVSSPCYPSLAQILSLVLCHSYSVRTKKATTRLQDHREKGKWGALSFFSVSPPTCTR